VSTNRPGKRRSRPGAKQGKGALEITGEAIHLLRTAPVHILASYYIGSAPFVLGLFYFWSDMSRSAFAQERCFVASLALALLFLWMKAWQAVFAAELRAVVLGKGGGDWTPRRALRLVAVQATLQPYGLLLIPAAMILVFPFYSVYTFYQNVTALADGRTSDLRGIVKRAFGQALMWPRQNHIVMWLVSPWVLATGMIVAFGAARLVVSLSPQLHQVHGIFWFIIAVVLIYYFVFPFAPFGCVVAANIAIMAVILPSLLRALLGVQTAFTLSGWHGVFNTTFLMTVLGLSYLFLDPIIKSVYVLRCFYGESWKTGEDLLAELRES